MEIDEYRSIVYDAMTIIDRYVSKSKRKEVSEGKNPQEAKEAWAEFVAGYAVFLSSAKVHPDDIQPAAMEHVKRSKYFPTPHEIIEIARPMGYVRAIKEQSRMLALEAPKGEPITEEMRAEINERMAEAEARMATKFATMLKEDREAIRAEFKEFDPSDISPARKKSIEEARLRIEKGGAA